MAKIIAITKEDNYESSRRYMVELTGSEIINLLHQRPKDYRNGFKPGEELDLQPLQHRLEAIEDREREVKNFHDALITVANRVGVRDHQQKLAEEAKDPAST